MPTVTQVVYRKSSSSAPKSVLLAVFSAAWHIPSTDVHVSPVMVLESLSGRGGGRKDGLGRWPCECQALERAPRTQVQLESRAHVERQGLVEAGEGKCV